MITAADLQARVKAVPFVPFRVTTSAGQTFDIRHRDFAFVTRRHLEVGVAVPEDSTLPDRMTLVFILHITSIETLPEPAGSTGPGANGTVA